MAEGGAAYAAKPKEKPFSESVPPITDDPSTQLRAQREAAIIKLANNLKEQGTPKIATLDGALMQLAKSHVLISDGNKTWKAEEYLGDGIFYCGKRSRLFGLKKSKVMVNIENITSINGEQIGSSTFAPPKKEEQKPPQYAFYDCVIVGSEPEAIVAAVAAARKGLKVLLISPSERLGGVWTEGGLNQLDITNSQIRHERSQKKGVVSDLYSRMGVDFKNRECGFDTTKAEKQFEALIASESNITLWKNAKIDDVLRRENGGRISVNGIVVTYAGRKETVNCSALIDGTGSAELVARVGKEGTHYTVGRSSITGKDETMAITPILQISNLNWSRVEKSAEAGADPRSAAGFESLAKEFAKNSKTLKKYKATVIFNGMNLGRNDDGTVNINGVRICGLDSTKKGDRERAQQIGQEVLKEFVKFLNSSKLASREGFGKAKYCGVVGLYVRETRHIMGEDTLTYKDVENGRVSKGSIATGSYPLDIVSYNAGVGAYQEYEKMGYDGVSNFIGKETHYGLTPGMSKPKGIDNLYVVGEPISVDPIAYGSTRVKPTGVHYAEALIDYISPSIVSQRKEPPKVASEETE